MSFVSYSCAFFLQICYSVAIEKKRRTLSNKSMFFVLCLVMTYYGCQLHISVLKSLVNCLFFKPAYQKKICGMERYLIVFFSRSFKPASSSSVSNSLTLQLTFTYFALLSSVQR